jgi:hypothetical protein
MIMKNTSSRLKKAELASGLGALVLGTGLGSLLAPYIGAFAIGIIVAGALVHSWGMFEPWLGFQPSVKNNNRFLKV